MRTLRTLNRASGEGLLARHGASLLRVRYRYDPECGSAGRLEGEGRTVAGQVRRRSVGSGSEGSGYCGAMWPSAWAWGAGSSEEVDRYGNPVDRCGNLGGG